MCTTTRIALLPCLKNSQLNICVITYCSLHWTHTQHIYRTNRFWRLARHIIIVQNRLSLTYSNVHSISSNNERKCTSRMLYISFRFRTIHMSHCLCNEKPVFSHIVVYLSIIRSHLVNPIGWSNLIKYIVTHKLLANKNTTRHTFDCIRLRILSVVCAKQAKKNKINDLRTAPLVLCGLLWASCAYKRFYVLISYTSR